MAGGVLAPRGQRAARGGRPVVAPPSTVPPEIKRGSEAHVTTDAIQRARRRADDRRRERVEKAAEALRRGDRRGDPLDAPPDVLDAAERLAERREIEDADARLGGRASPLIDDLRERLADRTAAVEEARRDAVEAIEAAAEAVAAAEDEAGDHAALRRDLRAGAFAADLDPGDLPSPSTESEARFKEAVRTAGRRLQKARREGGPRAEPGGVLDNLRKARDPDVAARRLRTLADRVEDEDVAELLRSDDAELAVRRRTRASATEDARREIRRRALRTGRLILAGETHRAPSRYPERVADILRAALHEPGSFIRGGRDLDAEVRRAADEVSPEDALRWATRRDRR